MNRWALAVAALLTGAVGLLHADYVMIKINLANAKEKQDEADQNAQGGVAGSNTLAPGLPDQLVTQIVERVNVHTEPNEENIRYLRTKRDRLGHLLEGGGL